MSLVVGEGGLSDALHYQIAKAVFGLGFLIWLELERRKEGVVFGVLV